MQQCPAVFRIGCGLSGRWARNLSGPIGAGLMYPPTINDDVSCAPACAGALALGWREARSPINCPGCLDRVRSPENRVAERARKETREEHQLFSLLPNPRAAMSVWSQNAEGSTGSPLEWGSCRGAAHALLGQARGESGERGPSSRLSAFHEGCRCFSSPTSGPAPTHRLNQRIAGMAELAAFKLLEIVHSLRRTSQSLFTLAVLVPGQLLNNGQGTRNKEQ